MSDKRYLKLRYAVDQVLVRFFYKFFSFPVTRSGRSWHYIIWKMTYQKMNVVNAPIGS
jgi:hypothetical protein